MRIIGIDASLSSTGWAVLDSDLMISLSTGAITTKLRGAIRLKTIRDELKKKIWTYADPDRFEVAAYIEGYSYNSHSSAYDLGELGGVIRVMLLDNMCPYHEIPPQTLKKWVTGQGNAKKETMLLKIYKRWGVEFATNDEADAYALARYGLDQEVW